MTDFFAGKASLIIQVLLRQPSDENNTSVKYHDAAFDALLALINYAHEKPAMFPEGAA